MLKRQNCVVRIPRRQSPAHICSPTSRGCFPSVPLCWGGSALGRSCTPLPLLGSPGSGPCHSTLAVPPDRPAAAPGRSVQSWVPSLSHEHQGPSSVCRFPRKGPAAVCVRGCPWLGVGAAQQMVLDRGDARCPGDGRPGPARPLGGAPLRPAPAAAFARSPVPSSGLPTCPPAATGAEAGAGVPALPGHPASRGPWSDRRGTRRGALLPRGAPAWPVRVSLAPCGGEARARSSLESPRNENIWGMPSGHWL